jgi:hypothetical protein
MPWWKFFTGDWLKDTALSKCTPAARGIWMDLLCRMREDGRRGEISGTYDQLAQLSRCTTAAFKKALKEFSVTEVANVTVDNKIVTVVNRRMKREHKNNKSNKLRQKRFRGKIKNNAPITGQRSEVRGQRSDNTTTEVVVEAYMSDPWFQMFRRCAGKHISDEELLHEIGRFKNRYPNQHPNVSGALVNTWVANIGRIEDKKTEKRMIV